MRTCRRCGGTYSDRFFVNNVTVKKGLVAGATKRIRSKEPVCIGCQQHARDTKKRANRPREKARRTIRTHAEKYIRLGKAKTIDDFKKRFGWDIKQMAHDIEHASRNGCKYCYVMFADLSYGLANITLDVINPEALPFYRTNTKWVCDTCNRSKKRKPPEEWEERMYDMKQWHARQEKNNPFAGLPIFDFSS